MTAEQPASMPGEVTTDGRRSMPGQPSEDLATEIAYGGGRSENIQVPARRPDPCGPCPRCGFYTDTPNHVYGCSKGDAA